MCIIIKTVKNFVFPATTSISATISITGFGLIVILISTGMACGLDLTSEIFHAVILKKTEGAQQNINSLDIFHRKCLPGCVIVKKEYDSLNRF